MHVGPRVLAPTRCDTGLLLAARRALPFLAAYVAGMVAALVLARRCGWPL